VLPVRTSAPEGISLDAGPELPSYRRNVMDYTGLMPGMVTAGENPQANGGQGGKDPKSLWNKL